MLYQQGTQRIEVIVRKSAGGISGGAGTKETTADKLTNSGGEDSESLNEEKGMSEKKKRMIKSISRNTLGLIRQTLDLSVDYYIGGIGYRSGDQALQDRVQRQVEIVKDTLSVASSVAMGALYGSWAGPIGAAVGAATGLASSGISLGLKYAGRQREYDYKVFKENNSIEYQRARAGLSLTYGRLR